MQIKAITSRDAGLVAQMVAALISELSDGAEVASGPLEMVASDLLTSAHVTGFLACNADGDSLGMILLNQCAAIYAGGIFGEITELYVEPEHRSLGVAARLVEAAEDLGRSRGWKRLEVGAPAQPAWQRTLAFYQRNGFQETGPRLRKPL
ncbi:GNAT family N-acetyltransferase [Phaeobacter sp. C3_T13_0]|uniref:GNAT family N-acetyltransferase n=1 Tax=Phaeobacter cretensis TaxID=3342641 RepID=UPI0039BC2887